MDEDAKLIEAHMKVHELMTELLKDAPPSLVAGIFQACATRIYKSILTQEEFQKKRHLQYTCVNKNEDTYKKVRSVFS